MRSPKEILLDLLSRQVDRLVSEEKEKRDVGTIERSHRSHEDRRRTDRDYYDRRPSHHGGR